MGKKATHTVFHVIYDLEYADTPRYTDLAVIESLGLHPREMSMNQLRRYRKLSCVVDGSISSYVSVKKGYVLPTHHALSILDKNRRHLEELFWKMTSAEIFIDRFLIIGKPSEVRYSSHNTLLPLIQSTPVMCFMDACS